MKGGGARKVSTLLKGGLDKFSPDIYMGESYNMVNLKNSILLFSIFISRCLCGLCEPMPTVRECLCCKECTKIVDKMNMYNMNFDGDVECITTHPGFEGACLNIWALETAYKQYRQQYGNLAGSLNE